MMKREEREKLKEKKKHDRKMKRLWKKDPVKAQYIEKAEEMEFNENIDDSYTSSVIDKYKKGFSKNHWFSASGIISLIIGVACLVAVVILGVITLISGISFGKFSVNFYIDIEEKKKMLIACFVLLPILGVLNILVGLKVGSFANFTREMLMNKTGFIMMTSFIQFIIGGVFFCFLTVIGYFIGRGFDYGAIYYNRVDGYNKNMSWDGQFSNKELQAIKRDIFNDRN